MIGSMQMCQDWGRFGSFALPVIYVLATYFKNYVTTYAPMVPLLGTWDFFFVKPWGYARTTTTATWFETEIVDANNGILDLHGTDAFKTPTPPKTIL